MVVVIDFRFDVDDDKLNEFAEMLESFGNTVKMFQKNIGDNSAQAKRKREKCDFWERRIIEYFTRFDKPISTKVLYSKMKQHGYRMHYQSFTRLLKYMTIKRMLSAKIVTGGVNGTQTKWRLRNKMLAPVSVNVAEPVPVRTRASAGARVSVSASVSVAVSASVAAEDRI